MTNLAVKFSLSRTNLSASILKELQGIKMNRQSDEIESIIFQALSHPMRRTIITLLDANVKGATYTELITELGLPTGKMNYHLEQLEGLIEKNPENRYVLTSLGKKALAQLRQLKHEVTSDDQKYLSIARKSQKASLEPTVKSFIIIGITSALTLAFILAMLTYVMLTEEGTPLPVLLLLPLLIAIDLAITATLFRALRNVPAWLRRIERRYIETF